MIIGIICMYCIFIVFVMFNKIWHDRELDGLVKEIAI